MSPNWTKLDANSGVESMTTTNRKDNTMKHTTGKWEVKESDGVLTVICTDLNNRKYYIADVNGDADYEPTYKANANLIASAPEMLEMLKSEREWMFKYVNSKDCPEHLRVKLPEWLKDDFRARFNLLEILIAKAEGGDK